MECLRIFEAMRRSDAQHNLETEDWELNRHNTTIQEHECATQCNSMAKIVENGNCEFIS